MRAVRASVVFVTLLLAVSACAGGGRPVDLAKVTSVNRPTPVGAEENPPASSGATAPTPNCDPKASFRPEPSLPAAGQMPDRSTMKAIQDRGQLIAGVDQNTFLFGFRNPTTNALEGFDIDIVREIAKAIFGDPNKVQFKVVTSAGRIKALQNGDVDVVVRTMTATCERWKDINFSAIYYMAGQRLLVDRASKVTTLDQLGGQKVCAAKGSTSIKTIAANPAKLIPVQVDNWSDCLIMLQQGQVEAVSTDDTILAGMVAQDPNVKMTGPRFTEEPYGIGIPKANVDMVKFVNGVLAKVIAEDTWARSYDKWLGQTGEPRPEPPAPVYQD
ncbi:glutamate ABC transporter substrate-binding protein [Actinophytocola algeriensis]|uniref:Polar amino acid transport system substrate-binding protein n=1 Tax=Actinophytocola algeriensis TaxID=1768010 RepID=A0A7W7Q431_9PSEU|nr:glutamate ABC transporter substrate-binding protein [Actinophytocola algeriensis]MBB4906319.1 polar amino acid transport system substrate-binding protein [Actinophytocola algeriensis]MBE1477800.1 polar amino acid transport system substrate-binding protein [Actinophytocola algeriensis]